MWEKLIAKNPMMAEPARAVRQMAAPSAWKVQQVVMGLIAAIIFLFFVSMTIIYSDDMEPSVMLYVVMGLLVLVLPITLHGVIAGEREKRSLDMLLAAPVTAQQIVAAKLMRGALPLCLMVAGFGIPAFIIAIKRSLSGTVTNYPEGSPPEMMMLLNGLLLVVAFAIFVSTSTVYVSSITRNTASALISSIGLVFFYLVILPAMVATVAWMFPWIGEMVSLVHPFGALPMVVGHFWTLQTDWLSGWFVPLFTVPLWLACAAFFYFASASRIEAERRQGDRRRRA